MPNQPDIAGVVGAFELLREQLEKTKARINDRIADAVQAATAPVGRNRAHTGRAQLECVSAQPPPRFPEENRTVPLALTDPEK